MRVSARRTPPLQLSHHQLNEQLMLAESTVAEAPRTSEFI